MSQSIHPTSIIEKGAEIGDGCQIGPYCTVGPNVKLGRNNILQSHVVLDGHTIIGDDNEIYPFACLGKISQDITYQEEWVVYSRIGNGNVFREYTTVNAASIEGESTIIGNDCLFLSYSHVAHDCVLGNNIIVSGETLLAGHVHVDDHAIINGMTGIVQFVHVGKYAFIGGFNKVTKDVLPYCIADGFPSVIRGINKIGLARKGFSTDQIKIIRDGYRTIIRSGLTLKEALKKLNEKYPGVPEVQDMITFAEASKVGLARPRKHGLD